MRFTFKSADEAVAAVAPFIPGPAGARNGQAPRCDACGVTGGVNKHFVDALVLCVDVGCCVERYRLGQTAEHYAAVLTADSRTWFDERSASSVDLVMSGSL